MKKVNFKGAGIGIIILTLVTSMASLYFMYSIGLSTEPIISNTGVETPYIKGGFFLKKVYWRDWQGDGVWGHMNNYEILGADASSFSVIETKVINSVSKKEVKIPVAKDKNSFYIMTAKLPFNPMTNPIVTVEFDDYRDVKSISTSSNTYYVTGRMAVANDLRFEIKPPSQGNKSSICKRQLNQNIKDSAVAIKYECMINDSSVLIFCDISDDPLENSKGLAYLDISEATYFLHDSEIGIEGEFGRIYCKRLLTDGQ